jgi:hypothetical protein
MQCFGLESTYIPLEYRFYIEESPCPSNMLSDDDPLEGGGTSGY